MTSRVKAAIERSISHNEIVTIDADAADLDCLRSESDDNVKVPGDSERSPMLEAWGTDDDDGYEWRVHARYTHEV